MKIIHSGKDVYAYELVPETDEEREILEHMHGADLLSYRKESGKPYVLRYWEAAE